MWNNKYEIAATEVLEIINHLNANERNKISKDFIEFLQKKSIDSYKDKIDFFTLTKGTKLKPETRSLLAIVYRDYLCNEEEKKEFDKILEKNEKKYLEEQRKKYNPDNLFKKEERKNETDKVEKFEVKELKKVEKQGFLQKIIGKIKQIFKNKS